jgi:hypothetical protein
MRFADIDVLANQRQCAPCLPSVIKGRLDFPPLRFALTRESCLELLGLPPDMANDAIAAFEMAGPDGKR